MKPGFPMSSLLPQAKKGRSSRSAPLEKCKDILALLGFRPLIKASCGVHSAGAALAASPIGRRIAPETAPVVATPVVFAPFVPAVVVPRSRRAPVPSEDAGRPEARASAADAAAASRARTASSARGAPRSASTSSGRTRRPCSGGRRSSSGCRPSGLPDKCLRM